MENEEERKAIRELRFSVVENFDEDFGILNVYRDGEIIYSKEYQISKMRLGSPSIVVGDQRLVI